MRLAASCSRSRAVSTCLPSTLKAAGPPRGGSRVSLITSAGSGTPVAILGAAMPAVSLLCHDIYASDPRESGFASEAADRYKLPVSAFDAHLDAIASVSDVPFLITVDDGGVSYYTMLADRLEARG